MEAELIRMDAGQVILRSSDGKEVAINLFKLSPADQVFVKTSVPGVSTVAKSVVPVAPLSPVTKTNAVAVKLFTFQEAQSLAGGLPESIKLRSPDDARLMLVQYGPEAGEVLYVVLDPPGPRVASDAAYVWSPAMTGFQIPRRIVGKPRTMKGAEAYVMEVPVSTKFGELSLMGTIQLISGVQDWWLNVIVGNFDVVKAGKSSSFVVSGFLSDIAVRVAEAQSAKPVRLLTDIVLAVYSHAEKGDTSTELKMGQYNMFPGKNMKNDIRVVIVDEKGVKIEEHGSKIDNKNLLSTVSVFIPEKIKSGNTYTTSATIDLGPIFGPQSSKMTFTLK